MLFYDHQLKKLSTDNAPSIRGRMMKKIVLIAASLMVTVLLARYADLLVEAPPPAPVPAWSWTGVYIGGNLGGGWAHPAGSKTVAQRA